MKNAAKQSNEHDPDATYEIELEDNGQDFIFIELDRNHQIVKTRPFQTDIWKGGYIPIEMVKTGRLCPIHKPPHINYGFLKHNVKRMITLK